MTTSPENATTSGNLQKESEQFDECSDNLETRPKSVSSNTEGNSNFDTSINFNGVHTPNLCHTWSHQ